ncbi:GGDEF domain-containing protein [Salmonella enterica subsp. enterica serovar Choleraesuis]|nr:GGDEF domain-containing protein [Salmonella enterica subsp. enterica serovar Choleraesuis]
MVSNISHCNKRVAVFLVTSTIIILFLVQYFQALQGVYAPFSPLLFPTFTIFLLVLHLLIAVFMGMRYLCDLSCGYYLALTFAFLSSAIFMVGTLLSYPSYFVYYTINPIKYNDAALFFTFRHFTMALMVGISVVLYVFRDFCSRHPRINTAIFIALAILLAGCIVLGYLCSSLDPSLSLTLVDDSTRRYVPLWTSGIGYILMGMWVITLVLMLWTTRMKDLFWSSGSMLCVCYIATLMVLLTDDQTETFAWHSSRIIEAVATLFVLMTLLSDVFRLYKESREKYYISWQNSIRDPLTRLYNRSYFMDHLNALLPKVTPLQPLSVIMSDLDHFKRINDTYGHLQGDKVIQYVAQTLANSVRENDIAARIGGEEFMLLLNNTNAHDAYIIAERIRKKIAAETAESSQGQIPETITISMGVFTSYGTADSEACVKNADSAMYQAKREGRNRVVHFDITEASPDESAPGEESTEKKETSSSPKITSVNDDVDSRIAPIIPPGMR